MKIVSLCCGTGAMERAMLDTISSLDIIGIDLGQGQLERARRKDSAKRIRYMHRNASNTGLPSAFFDRVLITLALHEMPRDLRLRVLAEAKRLCNATGQVIGIEHANPTSRFSRTLQRLWWFFWIPGNPEAVTAEDLMRRGLANEMQERGLQVAATYRTRPDWVEGVIAIPPHDDV